MILISAKRMHPVFKQYVVTFDATDTTSDKLLTILQHVKMGRAFSSAAREELSAENIDSVLKQIADGK